MKIAVPLRQELTFYHDNPYTAPKFAIYNIKGTNSHISFSLGSIVDNPWFSDRSHHFADEQITCNCDEKLQKDMHHICEHYALLDAISGCSYLLADHFCSNMARTLRNSGVAVFKIPFIINEVEIAIKNFLIGASLANTIQDIHHAS